ncbi:MAG: hypothetical protein HQK78_10895 [Desulfobacterales bacterium]|nr:hypothetical protein [Desulfobacterales bacterium]
MKKIIIVLSFILLIFTSNLLAEMKEIEDNVLEGVTGQAGFSSITRDGNLLRILLNAKIKTYGEVGAVKAGYYERNNLGDLYQLAPKIAGKVVVLRGPQDDTFWAWEKKANPNRLDWDQDWRDLKLGTGVDNPVTMNGLLIKAEWDDINSPNRKLNKLLIGTPEMRGEMEANMVRLTGVLNPDLMAGLMGYIVHNTGEWISEKPMKVIRDSIITKGNLRLALWPLDMYPVELGKYEFKYPGQGFFLELAREGIPNLLGRTDGGITALMGTNEYGQMP